MIPVDDAWENFNKQGHPNIPQEKEKKNSKFSPKCSDIYISTKTKIAYLNSPIDLMKIFWTIPVLLYQERREGVIKKQMKVNCLNEGEINNRTTGLFLAQADNLFNLFVITPNFAHT